MSIDAILLLQALVLPALVILAVIVALTLRKRTGVKVQDPSIQVLPTKAGRLKIVSVASSTPEVLSEVKV